MFGLRRLARWLGFGEDLPVIAVDLRSDEIWALAIRGRPLRVTALGRVRLPNRVAHNGEVRSVDQASDSLRALCLELDLPLDAPVVLLIQPERAEYRTGSRPDDDHIEAIVAADTAAALCQCAAEVGFSMISLDPVPTALSRWSAVGRLGPTFAAASGWMTVTDEGYFEADRRSDYHHDAACGESPSDLETIVDPYPVAVSPGVSLDGPWPVLLGAALSHSEISGPRVVITPSHSGPGEFVELS